MKKNIPGITVFLALTLFSILAFARPVLAADVYYAARGTAVVDAEKDEEYENAMLLTFGKTGVASVKTWVLWDEKNLYVFAEVYDKTPVDTPEDIFQPWNSDSIEIFINRNGKLTPSYEDDDFQYRIDINGNMSGMNKQGWGQSMVKDDLALAQAAAKKTEMGYTVEYAIPLLSVVGQVGSRIGFDIAVNNCDIPNNRSSIYSWGSGGNTGPNGWKVLELMETVPEELRTQTGNEITFKSGQNVALRKVAYMSTIPAWGNYPQNAVDGDETTYAQANEGGPVTFTLDLGYPVIVDKINLLFMEECYISEFKLEISEDNYIWNELKNVQNVVGGQKVNLVFEPVDFRYLRLTPIQTVGDHELYGYALCEIEAYAARDQVLLLDQVADNGAYVDLGAYPEESVAAVGNNIADKDILRDMGIVDSNSTVNKVLLCTIWVLVVVFVVQVIGMVWKLSKKRGGKNDSNT